jgi:hypothetical protein
MGRIVTCFVLWACLGSAAGIAAEIRLTIYDDGLSCPGDCDAHVVFHPSLNGTEFAHDPATLTAPFAPCVNGKPCRICLESGGAQCLTVTFRGAGPSRMTFDLTPKFYEQACAGEVALPPLAAKCRELSRAAAGLAGRVNCLRTPEVPVCTARMATARAAQEADRPLFEQCKAEGEARFNAGRPVTEQRSNACAYERKGTGGPNSRGVTWRRLLPGACRPGTFVGRDGLDCCSGSPLADGPLGAECRAFYPLP